MNGGSNSVLPMNGDFDFNWGDLLNTGLQVGSQVITANNAAKNAQALADAAATTAAAEAALAQAQAQKAQADAALMLSLRSEEENSGGAGGTGGGIFDQIAAWWNGMGTGGKVATVAVGTGLVYGGYKLFSKKAKKKR